VRPWTTVSTPAEADFLLAHGRAWPRICIILLPGLNEFPLQLNLSVSS